MLAALTKQVLAFSTAAVLLVPAVVPHMNVAGLSIDPTDMLQGVVNAGLQIAGSHSMDINSPLAQASASLFNGGAHPIFLHQ